MDLADGPAIDRSDGPAIDRADGPAIDRGNQHIMSACHFCPGGDNKLRPNQKRHVASHDYGADVILHSRFDGRLHFLVKPIRPAALINF